MICWIKFPSRHDQWETLPGSQIWTVTRHQYGSSALLPRTYFRAETSDIVSECQMFFPTTPDKNNTVLLVLVPIRAPESIQVQSTGPRSILIEWSPVPQQYVHGILRGYHVYYKTGKPKFKRSTSLVGVIKAMSANKSSQNLEITGLEPFTSYDVWVAAFTDAGSGPSSTPVTVVTDEDGKYITWLFTRQ